MAGDVKRMMGRGSSRCSRGGSVDCRRGGLTKAGEYCECASSTVGAFPVPVVDQGEGAADCFKKGIRESPNLCIAGENAVLLEISGCKTQAH